MMHVGGEAVVWSSILYAPSGHLQKMEEYVAWFCITQWKYLRYYK